MGSTDVKVFSVIVKIWVHDSEPASWHGQITHIPSGEQQYVSRLEDIGMIVSRYLAAAGIKPGRWMRVRQWLRHVK